MKTFAEMLPTATAEMREFVEATLWALAEFHAGEGGETNPIQKMRATPPAKEPVSVDGVIVEWSDGTKSARITGQTTMRCGDRVLVVKIWEAK